MSPRIVLSVAVVLLLGACGEGPVVPKDGVSPQFSASVEHRVTKVTQSLNTSSCSGEIVAVTVTRHVTVTEVEDANGGRHTRVSVSYHGSGIGLTTGNTYRYVGHTAQGFGRTTDGVFTMTFEVTVNLIGPGKGNHRVHHYLDHITRNANGDVTANFDLRNSECR